MKRVEDPTHSEMELEDDSVSLQGSFELEEFELGECVVPLKTNEPPKTNNTLRNVTEHQHGPLPPSPAPVKKKNLSRLASPMSSPGSLAATSINGRRTLRSSQGSLSLGGGNLHGRCHSPGALGAGSGSRHGRATRSNNNNNSNNNNHKTTGASRGNRTRSNSPVPPLLRSSSPGPLGGSLHCTSRSTSPGPLSGGSRHGPLRQRSNSPGALRGGSLHAPGSLRPRSRSPGTLVGRSRSFRAPRRLSAKVSKASMGPVSILRCGKFSGLSVVSTPQPSPLSPPQSPTGNSSHHRKRISAVGGRRVTFWLADEQSLACSFATEESMQFGDLGLDDSGDGLGEDHEYGQRTLRGELPFIEVMDYENGEYELKDNNDDEDDYLIKRFNGSTIHEELGASFGEGNFGTSFTSLLSDDDEEYECDCEGDCKYDYDRDWDGDGECPCEYNNEMKVKETTKESLLLEQPARQQTLEEPMSARIVDMYSHDNHNDNHNNTRSQMCNLSRDSSDGSFALPDSDDDDDLLNTISNKNKSHNNNNSNKYSRDSDSSFYHQSEGSFALPDFDPPCRGSRGRPMTPTLLPAGLTTRRRSGTPPPQPLSTRRRQGTPPPSRRRPPSGGGGGVIGNNAVMVSTMASSSSIRCLEDLLLTPKKKTNTSSSESSLDLSSLKEAVAAASSNNNNNKANRDSLSETSSESPTGVTELGQGVVGVGGGEDDNNDDDDDDDDINSGNSDDEDDTEHRRLKRSMVSKLVPPIG